MFKLDVCFWIFHSILWLGWGSRRIASSQILVLNEKKTNFQHVHCNILLTHFSSFLFQNWRKVILAFWLSESQNWEKINIKLNKIHWRKEMQNHREEHDDDFDKFSKKSAKINMYFLLGVFSLVLLAAFVGSFSPETETSEQGQEMWHNIGKFCFELFFESLKTQECRCRKYYC